MPCLYNSANSCTCVRLIPLAMWLPSLCGIPTQAPEGMTATAVFTPIIAFTLWISPPRQSSLLGAQNGICPTCPMPVDQEVLNRFLFMPICSIFARREIHFSLPGWPDSHRHLGRCLGRAFDPSEVLDGEHAWVLCSAIGAYDSEFVHVGKQGYP